MFRALAQRCGQRRVQLCQRQQDEAPLSCARVRDIQAFVVNLPVAVAEYVQVQSSRSPAYVPLSPVLGLDRLKCGKQFIGAQCSMKPYNKKDDNAARDIIDMTDRLR